MKAMSKPSFTGNVTCYACGKQRHKADSCVDKARNRLWCSFCKTSTHSDKSCRRKSKGFSVKCVNTEGENDSDIQFAFKVDTSGDTKSYINSFLVDCGATTHVVTNDSCFTHLDNSFDPEKHYIELADGTKSNNVALKKGTASVSLQTANGKLVKAELKNALYVPSYPQNIFSVQAATERGATVVFRQNSAELSTPDGTKFDIEKRGRLYYLCSSVSSTKQSYDLQHWHKILGHCNLDDVLKLENIVDGMRIIGKTKLDRDTCILGKMTQYRNRAADERASAPLELIHSDLAGPISPVARDGFKYAMSFIDDYSGAIFVYFLQKKSDSVSATERFLADVASYGNIKRLRSDNGSKYISNEYQSLLIRHRIKHERSAPYSPHENGTAERGWRTLFEMGRCLLLDAELPKEMWTYAVMTAAYIRNRCYNTRTASTPFQLLTGRKPDLSNMHIFGTVCFAYEQSKSKLDNRCTKGVFVGYDKHSPAYLVYYADSNKVVKCRCVKFMDTKAELEVSNQQSDDFEIRGTIQQSELEVHNQQSDNPEIHETRDVTSGVPDTNSQDGMGDGQSRYPKRQSKPPKHLEDYYLDDSTKSNIDYCCRLSVVPQTYQDAISSNDSAKWADSYERRDDVID